MDQQVLPPVLAGSFGHYAEARPSVPLCSHFRCVWLHQLPVDKCAPIIVVPDGCIDLRWIDGELSVAGPDRSAAIERIRPGATVIGLRFRPGSAAKWLGIRMSEIVNSRVLLEDLWGSQARRLADWAGEAETPHKTVRRLEIGLSQKVEACEAPDKVMERVFALLGGDAAFIPNMASLGEQFGLSERTLRRHCLDAFGYGPKTLERILRFQRFLKLIRGPHRSGLAHLAIEAGYADQPHLAREVKRLTGLSPGEIVPSPAP